MHAPQYMAITRLNTFPFVLTILLSGIALFSTLFRNVSGGIARRYQAGKHRAVKLSGHYHACAVASIKTQERQELTFLTSLKGKVNFRKDNSQKY